MISIFYNSHSSRQPGKNQAPGASSKRPAPSAEPMPDHALGNWNRRACSEAEGCALSPNLHSQDRSAAAAKGQI